METLLVMRENLLNDNTAYEMMDFHKNFYTTGVILWLKLVMGAQLKLIVIVRYENESICWVNQAYYGSYIGSVYFYV